VDNISQDQSKNKSNRMKKLAIILPCYNEEEILKISAYRLKEKLFQLINLNLISKESFICFVDDGSKDRTWEIIEELQNESNIFKGIKLSTNFGHQNALLAGMFNCKNFADLIITIDADLQDDINIFDSMLENYYNGNLIVYGVRDNRDNDTFFKKYTAQSFYKLMNSMNVKTIYNHADFRLVDSRVIVELEKYNESSMFLRGIFPTLGFNSTSVYYKRDIRIAGETKYPFKKMLNFAWNGITSFTTTPLRMIFYIGIIMFSISFIFGLWVLISALSGHAVKGWSSSLLITLTFSGINMICLGIIGEYIGKIYQEVKHRPRFIIEKNLTNIDVNKNY
jgi:glycosyltransferase involved in cell wall biosynthesis